MDKIKIRPTKVNKVIYFTIALGIVVLALLIVLAVIYNIKENGGLWLKFVDKNTIGFLSFILILTIIFTVILVKMITNPKKSVLTKPKKADALMNVNNFSFSNNDKEKEKIKPEDALLIRTLDSIKYLDNQNAIEKYTKNSKSETEKTKDLEVVSPVESEEEEIIPSKDGASRFYMLTQIDKEAESYVAPQYDNDISLKELCEQFRNFACNIIIKS
jgi:hypothetical protein